MHKSTRVSTITNPCNQYIVIWLLYTLQGTGYYNLGVLSVILHILLISYTLYYICYAHYKYKLPSFFHSIDILLILVFFYTLVRYAYPETIVDNNGVVMVPTSTLRSLYPLMSIFPFFVFVQKGYLTTMTFKKWVFVFTGAAILSVYGLRMAFLEKLGEVEIGEFTNSAGYYVLSVMPAVFIYRKKPFVQYLLLFILMFFVITSVKRGTIFLALIFFLFFIFESYKSKGTNRLISIVLGITVIVATFLLIKYLATSDDFFISRIEMTQEGSSSGRDVIYSTFFNIYFSSDFFHQLFGYGLDGTVKLYGTMAHNDWLEFLINMGVGGVLSLLYLFITMFNTVLKMKRNRLIFLMYGSTAVIIFIKAFFSMSVIGLTVYAGCIMGFCLGMDYKFKKRRRTIRRVSSGRRY